MPLLAAIADMIIPQIALAIGVLTSNRRGGWLPTLAGFTLGAIAGCHCRGAIAGCHTGVGAIARCHCWVPLWGAHRWMPLLGAIAGWPLLGAMLGCHCWVPLRGKIDRSVTPFPVAPFSILITHKLACAIWGLCWYNFFFILASKHQLGN